MKEIERTKQLQTIEMQLEYEKRRALTEVKQKNPQISLFLSNIIFFRMKRIESMNDIDSKIQFRLFIFRIISN